MSEKPLHILIVSSWFPNKKNPTDGTFVWEQANALQNRGHKVYVMKPNLSGTAKEYWTGKSAYKTGTHKYTYQNISIAEIVQPVLIPGLKQLNFSMLFAKCAAFMRDYIKKNGKPDIIHSHASVSGGFTAAYLNAVFNIPTIHTEHSSKLILDDYSSYNQLMKFFLERTQKILFVSPFLMEEAQKKWDFSKNKISVLPNMVASDFFKSTAFGLPKRFVMVGNYNEVKNPDFLFKIWEKWIEKHPDSSLNIIGSGYEKAPWKNQAENQSIQFLGRLNRKEIKDEMSFARCILSTSIFETFGLSLAEGLALNKLVIATKSGGPESFIQENCGFIIEQGDEDEFLNAMELVLKSDAHKNEQISQYAKSLFSEEIIIQQLESHYLDLL